MGEIFHLTITTKEGGSQHDPINKILSQIHHLTVHHDSSHFCDGMCYSGDLFHCKR